MNNTKGSQPKETRTKIDSVHPSLIVEGKMYIVETKKLKVDILTDIFKRSKCSKKYFNKNKRIEALPESLLFLIHTSRKPLISVLTCDNKIVCRCYSKKLHNFIKFIVVLLGEYKGPCYMFLH